MPRPLTVDLKTRAAVSGWYGTRGWREGRPHRQLDHDHLRAAPVPGAELQVGHHRHLRSHQLISTSKHSFIHLMFLFDAISKEEKKNKLITSIFLFSPHQFLMSDDIIWLLKPNILNLVFDLNFILE